MLSQTAEYALRTVLYLAARQGDELHRVSEIAEDLDIPQNYLSKTLHLLAIGYNVSERRRDSSYYDLLASEARFSSFVAIAQGQLPQESWFALGRLLTNVGGEPILVARNAWSPAWAPDGKWLYSRLENPTVVAAERKVALIDGRDCPYGDKLQAARTAGAATARATSPCPPPFTDWK